MLRRNLACLSALAYLLQFAAPAHAATNCQFVKTPRVWQLTASCTTDETILIPNNVVLDGFGFKITAIDPPGGNFQGPVLKNAGKIAHVANLFIRTNLADICHAEENKVIGVLFDGASGSASKVNVLINKADGASTCSEGVAVQAQTLPFKATVPFNKVTVEGSTLNYNQLAAVRALGNVDLRMSLNLIKGVTNPNIAQLGVEVTEGAKATLSQNEILRHSHAPLLDTPAYGILVKKAGAVTVTQNTLNFNDVAIRVTGGSKVGVSKNIIRSSALDGILVDDAEGPTTGIVVTGNDTQENTLNGINLQDVNGTLTKCSVKSNTASKNLQMGIVSEATASSVMLNTASLNKGTDIADFGTGNTYTKNVCDTSTGAPVDCPAGSLVQPPIVYGNCTFVPGRGTMVLQASCTTDQTIVIPEGLTLVGGGFKITAVDPAGGNFQGPVITNGGKVANVQNLFIRTNLADVCNEAGKEVVGVLLNNAAGTLSAVNILINKADGTSICPEGVAVQAQKLPFSTKNTFSRVSVKNSTLNYNQLAAVRALGNVELRVDTNLIKGLTNPSISTVGVEVTDGAKSYIVGNEIVRHSHSPSLDTPAYGIHLHGAGPATIISNTLNYNDVAIRVSGGTKISVTKNIIRSSLLDGIVVDDALGTPATGITVLSNDTQKNGLNGIKLESLNGLLSANSVKTNLTKGNLQMGLVVEGSANSVQGNTANGNTGLDIADFGTGNLYLRNLCDDSSGTPVDCPVPVLP